MSDVYVGSLISLLTSPSLLFCPRSPSPFSSPIGGLQIRYDSSGSLPGPGLGLLGAGAGGGGEALPPVATSIEQLLERQWNEGQNFLLQQGAQGDGEARLRNFVHDFSVNPSLCCSFHLLCPTFQSLLHINSRSVVVCVNVCQYLLL